MLGKSFLSLTVLIRFWLFCGHGFIWKCCTVYTCPFVYPEFIHYHHLNVTAKRWFSLVHESKTTETSWWKTKFKKAKNVSCIGKILIHLSLECLFEKCSNNTRAIPPAELLYNPDSIFVQMKRKSPKLSTISEWTVYVFCSWFFITENIKTLHLCCSSAHWYRGSASPWLLCRTSS